MLNDINGYALDYEQKKSVIIDEDNELIIAGAGSGKSLTLIGKIRYLIEEKNIKEEEILCISFTKDSMVSLSNKIKDYFGYNVDVYTFHKLALNILNYHIGDIKISPQDYLEYIANELFSNYNVDDKTKNTIVSFIRLFKSGGFEKDYFKKIYEMNNSILNKVLRNHNELVIKLIERIYYIYENELKSQGFYDFDDLIIKATSLVNNLGINKNYKYILIDEFQDASFVRFNLINSIRKCCDSKVIAVGDDFQSIYRFTGCNLDLFLDFEKYFGYTKIVRINNTYRNSNELINVAGNFIMKNKRQIKKNLKSNKHNKKPIKIYYYKQSNELYNLINYVYKTNKSNLFVISRNNNDINKYLSKDLILDNDFLKLKNINDINIRYLTAHKSKGLEEDNVILINIENAKLGFPSKITDDDILNYVMVKDDNYPYSEERRLFYVALTRTKNNVYIFVKRDNESIFLKELVNCSKGYIDFIN